VTREDDTLGEIEESEDKVAEALASLLKQQAAFEELKAQALEIAKTYGPKIAKLALHVALGL
jgi:hypothetical protein